MTGETTGPLPRVAVVARPGRRLTAILTVAVGTLLTFLSWPVGSLVAGVFVVVVGVACRRWSPAARIAFVLVGSCVAVGSAVVLADFSTGSSIVTSRS